MLEEPEPSANRQTEGHLHSAATNHFITKTCPGKTIEHKSMKTGYANTTTMNSTATRK